MKKYLLVFLTLFLISCSFDNSKTGLKTNETEHTHIFDIMKSNEINHWQECDCGEINEKIEHSGGVATETQKAICEVCNQPYGELLTPEHLHEFLDGWQSDDTYHWKECSCGEINEKVLHSGGSATCTSLAKCHICEEEYGLLLEHNYTELEYDENNHWYKCLCGAIKPNSSEVHFGGNATAFEKAKCEVCGKLYGELLIEINCSYPSHPSSEPNHNQQLQVINHIGDIDEVWNYYRGEGVSVAVIDSGFDINHPEFINVDGSSRISELSVYIYTDSSGKIKKEVGRNKVGITDGDSHGTMCAGLLGSAVNGKGITGIAPECELILIKIDKKISSMAEAFKYCGDNNIKVVSVSLGTYPSLNGSSSGDLIYNAGINLESYFNESINYAYAKGVTIVSAVGNDKSTSLTYPGGCPNVIGAGGMMAGSDTLIWDEGYEGTNYNGTRKYVDVLAPASGIYAPGYDTSKNMSTYWSNGKGTSFAAPIIAGAAALYFQKYPNKTNKDFEDALKNTSMNVSKYNNNKDLGYGKIDIGRLLNIEEDIKKTNYNPTTTISKEATKIVLIDEAGWNIRTLHIYNLTFEPGYGYYDFEKFLSYHYGYVLTKDYKLEGSKKCWAYSDQGWSGDYFIAAGNTDNGIPTTHEYILPWWVKGATYQFVNNSNWLPKEGLCFSKNDGYLKTINNYFWYKSSSDTGVAKVIGLSFNYDYPAVNVIIDNQINKSIIYDYYEMLNLYYDAQYKYPFTRCILTDDIILYKK